MAKTQTGTYVYCVVAAARRPAPRRLGGLPGMGPVRLLDVDRGLWLAVADAPLDRYGEDAINHGLSDLDWVSRAAVAHETVVESFINATAVLPMKLFTIFVGDDRALDHIRRDRQRIDALIKRVGRQHEWGVRVVLDRARAASAPAKGARTRGSDAHGIAYLVRKKAQRDRSVELAEHARGTMARLYDRLAAKARLAKRRTASDLPIEGGPLLLDAAFLVPRSRSATFRAAVARDARALERQGYGVTLTGPWPPYSFI
jgi:hypothetical protein